jgi:hypothetical protein
MKLIFFSFSFLLVAFVAPAIAAVGWWAAGSHPTSWRNADWSSSGMLPQAKNDNEAAIYVFTARTGGMKGALATHSWIVLKPEGAQSYQRFDKVGWGSPIRQNAYDADGRWYSNQPEIVFELHGGAAAKLLPKVQNAIADYPFAKRGGYTLWPGPNSNTFVAHVLRAVPELGASLPPEAVGRDFPSEGRWFTLNSETNEMRLSIGGYVGFATSPELGLELNFAGLVFGIDPTGPALKLPGFGRIGWGKS